MNRPIPRGLLYALFALSGFAGLIYESIWSHYLKLMLGHAAYAQTLVLVIFMGGMAIGSWMAGRWSQRVTRPLLWYAGVEALLGLAALLFDQVFRGMSGWLFESVIPALGAGWAIDTVKWMSATLLTLPQAIMLGATFPLMSTGLLRMYPNVPGRALSWLYFTNSLGASVGVLASGFYLIGKIGLPGTILTAGLINFLLAGVVYLLERPVGAVPPLASSAEPQGTERRQAAVTAMLWTAALTGGASFMYEIGWIRMLSLVLGSATHSFELMLSAFILGLALGSFFIRKRIDDSSDPLRLLGWIQVLMALLALLSIPLYMQSFDAMAAALKALQSSAQGYVGFTMFAHLICLALMLPVTFCAGMTLPLITAALLRAGRGEGSIGRVYAANTIGAIVGVLLAVHVVMPLFGLRMVVVTGAMVDMALGLWLILRAREALAAPARLALAAALVLALGLSLFTELDPRRTASGVFRHGRPLAIGEVIFHRDGKTATVDVIREKSGLTTIATNGKVDAGIFADKASLDDHTMILAAAIPMAMLPDAKDVAVIGMGSGRTTHSLLANSRLERVDTIEIEPAMVDGARHFGKAVERAFSDPRSHVTIEDAKTYFARKQRQYDIVVSEPSNPWVSGVATLFSQEFYHHIKHYIRPNGLLVQWIQLYEIDVSLISTVFNALGEEFHDYQAFYTVSGDMLIVASAEGSVPPMQDWIFRDTTLGSFLSELKVSRLDDLEQRRLGSAWTLKPFFQTFGWPANSDYFPVLDQHAAERRFMRQNGSPLTTIQAYSARLENRPQTFAATEGIKNLPYTESMAQARLIDTYYAGVPSRRLPKGLARATTGLLQDLQLERGGCDPSMLEENWLPSFRAAVQLYGPWLSAQTGERIVAETLASSCAAQLTPAMKGWLGLLRAQTKRDWPAIVEEAQHLLDEGGPKGPDAEFLLSEAVLAALKAGGRPLAEQVMEKHMDYPRESVPMRYLLSNLRSYQQ